MTTRRESNGTGAPGDPLTLDRITPVSPIGELTYTVSLPVVVHETPEHEAALAIADVPVMPVYLDGAAPVTTSVTVIPQAVLTMPDFDFGPVIPALPESDDVRARRPRPRRDMAHAPASAPKRTDRHVPETKKRRRQPPEGLLQKLLYDGTFHLVNVGDSYAVRQRKALEARIGRHFDDGTRFIPVLSRKGGVGKTTVATLMAMAMADVRDDRVIAIDANPDRGTLAERVTKTTRSTVRDAVKRADAISEFDDFRALISRDETDLDVLASGTDPAISSPFGAKEFNVVADLAEQFYSVAITDGGAGLVDAATKAALERADTVVIVSGGSVDEARVASETLTWLETNGYAELASNAVLALNTATNGTNLMKVEEIEAHFAPRVREIVRIPYDPMLATGSVIHYRELKPFTREAARDLAALVVDGLPSRRDA